MENEKKQHLAIIIGFVLILLVILSTLFRSKIFTNTGAKPSAQENSQASDGKTLEYPTISAQDLQKKIMSLGDKRSEITLIDIRPFESYIAEHILDSINLPIDDFSESSKLDAHKQIYLIATNGADTNIKKVIDKLKDQNITNVVVLAGGMESWKQFVGITVSYGDPKSFTDQAKVAYTDAEQVNEALTAKVPMYILDVRSNELFQKGHIPGAVNIPFDELEKRRSEIKERKVVVIGSNELEEFQASVQIYDMLLVSPFVVRGAMPKWQEKSFPMIN